MGSFAAKTHFSQIIDDVTAGAEYTITKRGKPVARIMPYSAGDSSVTRREALAQLEKIRNSVKESVSIRQFINEGRKR